jgi:hypothetical protein
MRCVLIIRILGALGALLAATGCAGSGLKDPDASQMAVIVDLTRKLGKSDEACLAGLDLGEIGITYCLPPPTLEAMKVASGDRTLGYADVDCFYIGGGREWYEAADGVEIAFLMWRLRDMNSGLERIKVLWNTFCTRHRTDAVPNFCINKLVEFKGEEVIPYLFAAAVMGNWYQSRVAALHLGDYWPVAKPLLLLLAKSDREDIAEIARRNLRREGRPLPPDGNAICDVLYGIPAWPGITSGK